MEFDVFDLFKYLKNEEFDKIDKSLDYIVSNKVDNIDLNIKDDMNNYIINYLIILNKHELINKLLKIDNIKIDIFDAENKSILYVPIKYNYTKIFKYLLDYNMNTIGISICDIRDNNNNIALHYAIKNKNYDFIEELLKNDSHTLFADSTGMNALHLAIYTRELKIVELILKYAEKNIIINSRTNIGETALHFACNLQEIKIVKFLLNNGADINLQDYEHEYNILSPLLK
jgi:ankyrin repeat protein